ncbi:MAG: M28 family peptidase [Nitrososphaerota archaeon]
MTQNSTPRVTGYPGFYKAQEYVYQKFVEVNLTDVQYQWYNVTVPVDLGGELTVYSSDGTLLKTYKVNPLWPNSVQVSSTPPGGIRAGLFYAGRGDYGDYNGHMVNESIVILDFNTQYNWLKAMELGAKAVVFIEPDDTSNFESLTKYLYSTPIYAPRVYLKREDAGRLLSLLNQHGGTLQAKFESRMEWQVKRVANIIGFSPGTTLKDQWIIFFAHFDAWSVVPSLTEGATDACGIAGLLELARFCTSVEHARSIMFVALSGYGEGLYGARYFVDSLIVGDAFPQVVNPDQAKGQGIFLYVGIDLSPESESIGTAQSSEFYYSVGGSYRDYVERIIRPFFYGTGGYIDKIKSVWQSIYGRTWTFAGFEILTESSTVFVPTSYILDLDAFPGRNRFTYQTVYAWFDRKYTPLDTFSRLEDLNSLKPQMEFIFCTSYELACTTDITPDTDITRAHWSFWGGAAFNRFTSQVVIYNESTANYESLPRAIVQIQLSPTERVFASLATWFEMADDKGFFTSYVVPRGRTIEFHPYLLNQTTGRILCAPDLGRYGSGGGVLGAGRYPNVFRLLGPEKSPFYGSETSPITLVAFKCGTIQLFNIDASEGRSAITLSTSWIITTDSMRAYTQTNFVVNNPFTHASLASLGYRQEPLGPYETNPPRSVVVFVPGNTHAEIILSYTGQLSPLAILHNSSLENPLDGHGYTVEEGQILSILNTPLVAAKEFNYLNGERIKSMEIRNIFTTGIDYTKEANKRIALAEEALNDLNYSAYYNYVVSALSVEREAYYIVKSDLYSVLSSTLTLFITVLLFAYLAERLFFSSIDLRSRALGIALMAMLGLVPLIICHPGFTIAGNVYVSIYGIVVLVFISMVWALLFGYSLGSFRRLREKLIGKHFLQVSRVTSMMTGMGIGLQYMKKRRLRASLTLTTLVIVSASMVMFTSVTNITFVKPATETRDVAYPGIFVKEFEWNPLNPRFVDYVSAKVGEDNVFPRAWLYARMPVKYFGFLVIGPNGTARVQGAYGLTPQEGAYVGWTNYLKEGLWFEKEDYDWCILSESLAAELGAKVGDTIMVMGARLRVRGILYDGARNVNRLDGYMSSLKDPEGLPGQNTFIAPRNIIYVPYSWAVGHGGKLHEVIIAGGNFVTLGLELAKEINLDFYVANSTGTVPVEFYSRRTGYMVSGYEFVTLPLVLVALTVLNLMLGAVYERIKEIAIFSTVGLSPRDVGMMFLSESVSYGVIGVILGYIAGVMGLSLLLEYKALPPGIYPNYSSSFIVQTIGLIIMIVVLSSLFPFLKSAKLVTPSLERKWKITTKPLGDQWNIPTPFNFSSEQEARGFIEYMREYFGAYTIESPGFPFATHELSFKQGFIDGIPYKSVIAEIHLAPFPANVNQSLELMVRNVSGERWTAEIVARRRTGDMRSWMSSNQKFLDKVRKQFISWRLLSPSEKEKYYTKWS